MASPYARQRTVQVVGVLTGLWLGSYSFIAPNAPEYVLYPASLLIVVWFVVLAVSNRPGRFTTVDQAPIVHHRADPVRIPSCPGCRQRW